MKATCCKIIIIEIKKCKSYISSLKLKLKAVKYKQIINKAFIYKLVTKVFVKHTKLTKFAKYLSTLEEKSYNFFKV